MVKLIAYPNVNWSNWITTVKEINKVSPNKLIDSENRFNGDLYSFIASLGFFAESKSPNDAIRYMPWLLKHLSFSFLIESDNDYSLDILKNSNIALLKSNDLYLLTANLYDWKESIIIFTNKSRPFGLRFTFDAIYLHFSFLKLELNCNKVMLSDGTFTVKEYNEQN